MSALGQTGTCGNVRIMSGYLSIADIKVDGWWLGLVRPLETHITDANLSFAG